MKLKTFSMLLALGSSVQAAVLSINLTNTDGPRQIQASETTGVIAVSAWENISTATTNVAGTGVNITPSKAVAKANTLRDSGSGDGTNGFLALYEAGLKDSTPGTVDSTITISGMSAFLAAESATEYRILAYYKSPIDSGVRTFKIRVGTTSGTGTFATTATPDYSKISAGDSFVKLGGADNNWMEFTGLTADTAVIEIDRTNRDGMLTGFQIETIPEPSSTALLGLGGLALTLRRRK